MPTVDLMVLGEHGQIGNKEQVVEQFDGARFTMGLEDRYVVDMVTLVALVKLQNPLVHVRFGFIWETLPSGRGHGTLIEGRCRPGDMSSADHRVIGLRPAKDVRNLHGEDGRLIVSRTGLDSELTERPARKNKVHQKRR
jgi:hypothetical protein